MNKVLMYTAALVVAVSSFFIGGKAEAAASQCATPLSTNTSFVTSAYQEWKKNHVTSSGAGGNLRVQRSSQDGYDTVSEGVAYGMIFAVYNNDKSTFDGLWKYSQTHLDAQGLMHWRIDSNGNTSGWNAATDADEDIAVALIAADKLWGGYTAQAKKQIGLIKQYEVEQGTNVLKPGDVWGGSDVLNPSYLAPAYYDVYRDYTGDSSWNNVKTAGYKTLDTLRAKTPAGTTGLFPDWSTNYGTQANGMGFDYGYDAVRSPIRLATSSLWSCDADANRMLVEYNNTFSAIGVTNAQDVYRLNGQGIGWKTNVGMSPVVTAAMTSTDSAYRTNAWNAMKNSTAKNDYYGDSLRLFSALVSTGMMVNPLTLKSTQQTVAPTTPTATTLAPTTTPTQQTASINIWWPSNGSAVTGVQPFKAVVNDKAVTDYVMYWQVDDGQLNLMNNDYREYPHKQSDVDVTGWSWRGSGPYKITFVAKNANGATIATSSTNITIAK